MVAKRTSRSKKVESTAELATILRCKYCGHPKADHAKLGKKPDHPHWRSLAKAGANKSNTSYFPTSESAYCENPLCDCTNYVEV